MYSLNHSIYQNWSSVSNCLILKGILIHLNCNQLLGSQLGEKVNLSVFHSQGSPYVYNTCLTLMNNFAWFRKQFKIWKMSCCCKWRDKTKISWISKIYQPSLEIWDSRFFFKFGPSKLGKARLGSLFETPKLGSARLASQKTRLGSARQKVDSDTTLVGM